jgi:hypothetical protein
MLSRLIGRDPAFTHCSSLPPRSPRACKSGWSLPYLVQRRNRPVKSLYTAIRTPHAPYGSISRSDGFCTGGRVLSFCEVCFVMTTDLTTPGPTTLGAKRKISARTLASSTRV